MSNRKQFDKITKQLSKKMIRLTAQEKALKNQLKLKEDIANVLKK